jgi:hypothetical protein
VEALGDQAGVVDAVHRYLDLGRPQDPYPSGLSTQFSTFQMFKPGPEFELGWSSIHRC